MTGGAHSFMRCSTCLLAASEPHSAATST